MTYKKQNPGQHSEKQQFLEQIITTQDLQHFKDELLQEIRNIIGKSVTSEQKKWIKSYEVRKILDISSGTLQNLRLNGTLPYSKIGGAIYYSMDDIQKMINAGKQSPAFP